MANYTDRERVRAELDKLFRRREPAVDEARVEPGSAADEVLAAAKRRLGIEGKVVRVFKADAQKPPTKTRNKGWLYREIRERRDR